MKDEFSVKNSRCQKKLNKINRLDSESKTKYRILKKFFGHIGEGCTIKPNFYCDLGCNIHMGDNVLINFGVVILDSEKVWIGNNVLIGPNTVIAAAGHPLDYKERRTKYANKKVVIEDDVWIGANVTILPGVTIHKRAVIGGGAVVTHDVAENAIVAGVPAKLLRKLD